MLFALFAGTIFTVSRLTEDKPLGSFSDSRKESCTTDERYSVAVGPGNANQIIIGTSSPRAYAKISLLPTENMRNYVFLLFNHGEIASSTDNGIGLSASTTPSIEFGLNTSFPYTGSVTGITSIASTTLQVTECNF